MNEEFEGLNLVELIDLLEPAPVPEPVSLLPQTEAWVVLAVVLVVATFFARRRWLDARRRTAHRRAALAALDQCGGNAAEIAAIIRRTALVSFPRREVGALHGEAWLGFLDRAYGGTGFSAGPGRVLATAPYRPVTADPGLAELAATWIRDHRAPEGEPTR